MCLDVINQTWSPMFDMINIFEVFLPQLLRYPNAADPLNGEAAALLMRDAKGYDVKVKGELSSDSTCCACTDNVLSQSTSHDLQVETRSRTMVARMKSPKRKK